MNKLSVYISVICVSLLLPLGVHAQTPTPHPDALSQGLYQFESLTAPQINLTGSDWTVCASFSIGALCNDDPANTLTFFVEDVDYFVIKTYFSIVASAPSFQVCIESVCGSYSNRNESGWNEWAFNVGGNAQIVLTTLTNADILLLDYMTLHPMPVDLSAISGTTGSSPTPTPEPYIVYGSVSGTSGDVETRFDMAITVGDIAVSSALLFLLFSLWAFIFLVIIPRKNHHVGE
jgi:hypothetical protein